MTPQWRKSSYSDTGGNCVECRATGAAAHVRDTQNRERGHLTFPAGEWAALLADVRRDRL